jgi:hypothetical protein
MTQSNTNGTTTVDEAERIAGEILEHYETQTDGNSDATNAVLDFFESDPTNANIGALEYYAATDPGLAKGKEIVSKLGPDATFGDLDEAIKNGTISPE